MFSSLKPIDICRFHIAWQRPRSPRPAFVVQHGSPIIIMRRHLREIPLRHVLLSLLVLALALGAGACANAIQEPAAGGGDPPATDADLFRTGVQKFGSGVAWSDSLYDLVASYDLFSYQVHNLYSDPRSEGLIDELRSRNDDIRVGGYFQAHGVQDWQLEAMAAESGNFASDWAAYGVQHLARTTKGDTARSFNGSYMIDVTKPGVVEGMVEVLRRWRASSDNNRAGTFVMVDHCSVPHLSWLTGEYALQTDGDLDLDGDGVGHLDDPDEQLLLRDAYVHLVDELHRVLPDVKVVVNGDLVRIDREFRNRVDGMYIEGGFRWGWGSRYFETALIDPGERNLASMLADMRDGGFSLYEWKEDYRVGWAVSMFFDNLYPLMAPGHESLPFVLQEHPGEWDMGRPLGPASVEDGILRREFERGTASLEPIQGASPGAFRFRLSDSDRGVLVTFNEGS